jgi:hypothetical protein
LAAELEAAELAVPHPEPEAELLRRHGTAEAFGALEGEVLGEHGVLDNENIMRT